MCEGTPGAPGVEWSADWVRIIRQKIEEKIFDVFHIPTEYNLADIFTKGLTGERTQMLAKMILGMVSKVVKGKEV